MPKRKKAVMDWQGAEHAPGFYFLSIGAVAIAAFSYRAEVHRPSQPIGGVEALTCSFFNSRGMAFREAAVNRNPIEVGAFSSRCAKGAGSRSIPAIEHGLAQRLKRVFGIEIRKCEHGKKVDH
jgi:hypothetical protein